MFKRSFWEQARYLQDTAKTVEEAKARAEKTCSLCNKQAYCNESLCPFMKAHKTKVLCLESKGKGTVKVVKTRPYKKATPKANAKKAVLNYLTRITKEITDRRIQIIVDDASVMAELGELESCYWVLRNGKLLHTAERVKSIYAKIKEVA